MNLLHNAIKFSPPGRRRHRDQPTSAGRVVISVTDHGMGIPRPDQARVFERFYKVDRARQRGLGGTGLGLAIARHIAEAHGGRIWLESTEGQGSTFSFSHARYRLSASGAAGRQVSSRSGGRSQRSEPVPVAQLRLEVHGGQGALAHGHAGGVDEVGEQRARGPGRGPRAGAPARPSSSRSAQSSRLPKPPARRSSTRTVMPSSLATISAVCRARTLGLLTMTSGRMPCSRRKRPSRSRLRAPLGGQRPQVVVADPARRIAGVGVAQQVEPQHATRHRHGMPVGGMRTWPR